MRRPASGRPVMVGSRPVGHLWRQKGLVREAGYDHGENRRTASVFPERILSSIQMLRPAGVRLIIISKHPDTALDSQGILSVCDNRSFDRVRGGIRQRRWRGSDSAGRKVNPGKWHTQKRKKKQA